MARAGGCSRIAVGVDLSADDGEERERLGQRAEDAREKACSERAEHVDVTRWSRHAEKQRRDRPGNRARGS